MSDLKNFLRDIGYFGVGAAAAIIEVGGKAVKCLVRKGEKGSLTNGILYLKGGDLTEELKASRRKWERHYISEFFEEEFFETKKVVYTPKK